VDVNMSDYSNSKKYGTKALPADAKETSGLVRRIEPIMTPELLASRYLHGIDLSGYAPEELKQEIMLGIQEIELLTGLHIDKVQMQERIPYDMQLYKSFIHIKVNHRPILSVESIKVMSTNRQEIYRLPLEWVEAGFFHKGQINVLPILSVFGSSSTVVNGVPSGALIFLQGQINMPWLPAFWEIEYTTGVCHQEGHVPVLINDLIGMTAATEILGALQANNIYNSQSLSQDGISQSSSSAGPQIYQKRIDQLNDRRERLLAQIKKVYHTKYFMSNI
jgi:hypothetical protein